MNAVKMVILVKSTTKIQFFELFNGYQARISVRPFSLFER